MAFVLMDMKVCSGGNHVTFEILENGDARSVTVDLEDLMPTKSFAEVATFMAGVAPENVEPLYRAIMVNRNVTPPASTFEAMRVACMAAMGAQ